MDFLSAAMRYAECGLRIIPVKPRGKLPLTQHGAHDASSDEALIRRWWSQWPDANIGLNLSGLVAVDIDPRNGGDADLLPAKLPETCYARTGGGGLHYLYRANSARYAGHPAPGIDVKTGGGAYIVVEPSVHPSGGTYCWLDESEPWAQKPAEAPAWLAQIADIPTSTNDEGKIASGSRNAYLTSLAGSMRRRGASTEALLAALHAENAARCDPPLPDADVRRIADSVGRYAVGQNGASQPDDGEQQLWPDPLDLRALSKLEPVHPQHIIPGWLPAGEVTLIAGHGGSGKSAIALHIAACIALGVKWLGLDTARRRVLYVSAEDPASIVHWRLSRICAYLGVLMEDLAGHLDIIDVSHLDAELMIEARGDEPVITAAYEELRIRKHDAQVLILDGASDLYGASEIVRRHVRRYIRMLRRLIPVDGAALLLAHVDKAIARGRETGDRYSGSTAWNNSVRARWGLWATTGDRYTLKVEKANHSRAGSEITLRWDPAAHMHLIDLSDGGIVASIRDRTDRDCILAAFRACAQSGIVIPAATTGPRTAYNVLRAQPSFPPNLATDAPQEKRRFWAQIELLRACGDIKAIDIRAANRKNVATLVLSHGA